MSLQPTTVKNSAGRKHPKHWTPADCEAVRDALDAKIAAGLVRRGVRALPFTSRHMVVGPIASATFSVFEALAERNNEALDAFRLGAVEDELIKLRSELDQVKASLAREGKKPDRYDRLTQAAVASEFVHAVSEAPTTEKREAIVHATARQFDPRRGEPSVRAYLLRRLREMSEIELTLVLLLTKYGELGMLRGTFVACDRPDVGESVTALDLSRETYVALLACAQTSSASGSGAFIAQAPHGRLFKIEGQPTAMVRYQLTGLGEALAAMVRAD